MGVLFVEEGSDGVHRFEQPIDIGAISFTQLSQFLLTLGAISFRRRSKIRAWISLSTRR